MPKKPKYKRLNCTSIKISEEAKQMFYHLKKESQLLKGITMSDLLEEAIEKRFIEYCDLDKLNEYHSNKFFKGSR